jgi:hypothetical protein
VDPGHDHVGIARVDRGHTRRARRLRAVVELGPDRARELRRDRAQPQRRGGRVDRRRHRAQRREIGVDRVLHPRDLHLHGHARAVVKGRGVHLRQRRRRERLGIDRREPPRADLRIDAGEDRRRVDGRHAIGEAKELARPRRRQEVRARGRELAHLEDRPAQVGGDVVGAPGAARVQRLPRLAPERGHRAIGRGDRGGLAEQAPQARRPAHRPAGRARTVGERGVEGLRLRGDRAGVARHVGGETPDVAAHPRHQRPGAVDHRGGALGDPVTRTRTRLGHRQAP